MTRATILIIGCLLSAGCEHFQPRATFQELGPGLTREQVAELVGSPAVRHTLDEREAWLYCVNGWLTDDFAMVIFEGATVSVATIERDTDTGHCEGQFDAFSWETASAS